MGQFAKKLKIPVFDFILSFWEKFRDVYQTNIVAVAFPF